jgi:mRNA-degrading endonuclease RelE of RelBE toxin-antitoxin system
MSLSIVIRDTALRNLARLRGDDKDLFTRARQAITQLADQPRPAGAIPWGATGVYRLHAGSIRILYEVDDAVATIYIINVAVTR